MMSAFWNRPIQYRLWFRRVVLGHGSASGTGFRLVQGHAGLRTRV